MKATRTLSSWTSGCPNWTGSRPPPDLRRPGRHRRTCGSLILTTYDLDEYVYAALQAGASGFLLKDSPPADILTAIRLVADGEALLAPSVTRRLIAEFARRPEPARAPARTLDSITSREREVLTLIGRGLSNAEIASHLHITHATTRTHVGHLLTKLQARDRAQLVITAYETGLVTAGPRHQ